MSQNTISVTFISLFKETNLKHQKMKKIIFLACLMMFTLSASTVFAMKSDPKSISDNPAVPTKTENKLSEQEISRITKRVEEIRNMDKTKLTTQEKRELKKELKEIKKSVKASDGTVVIGAGTLLLIIIILILLL
jgi:hypothetical protein